MRMSDVRLTILALLVAIPASAHDLWIEPSSFHPATGERVTAALATAGSARTSMT